MRTRLLTSLRSPNERHGDLRLFGVRVRRFDAILRNVAEADLRPDDDVLEGVLVSRRGVAFPIDQGVSLLRRSESDSERHISLLMRMRSDCPWGVRRAIDATVDILSRNYGALSSRSLV